MNLPLLAQPQCVQEAGWCQTVFDWTGNEWLASYSELLIAKPMKIILILLISIVVRYVAHRTINQLTKGNGKPPKLLKPLKERKPDSLTAELMSERRQQRARTIGSVLKSLASALIYGLAVIYVLQVLGIEVAPVLASAGVVGVAVAFGAQNLVRDFLSGMFMLMEDQYGVGDVVDLGEATGTVEAVGLRVTTLRDIMGTVWYVRNGEILRVGNKSQNFAIALVDIPISHDSNVQKALDVAATSATTACEREPLSKDVLGSPSVLGVDQITAEGVTLRVTVKVRPGRQWAVQRGLRAAIKAAFAEEHIAPPVPFPGQPKATTK